MPTPGVSQDPQNLLGPTGVPRRQQLAPGFTNPPLRSYSTGHPRKQRKPHRETGVSSLGDPACARPPPPRAGGQQDGMGTWGTQRTHRDVRLTS